MKRLIDVAISLVGLLITAPLFALVALAVRLDSPGPAIFWSQRFGRGGKLFAMPKFRTMSIDTPQLATHLLSDPASRLTGIGGFLRRSSLDELPQLWSVLLGDMSLVGPRPALHNQHDLMEMRLATGVSNLKPGITGWAQINGRDDLDLPTKVAYEADYLVRQSVGFDFRILALTAVSVLNRHGVSH